MHLIYVCRERGCGPVTALSDCQLPNRASGSNPETARQPWLRRPPHQHSRCVVHSRCLPRSPCTNSTRHQGYCADNWSLQHIVAPVGQSRQLRTCMRSVKVQYRIGVSDQCCCESAQHSTANEKNNDHQMGPAGMEPSICQPGGHLG